MQTADMAVKNIEALGQLFPNCLTETKNAEGKVVQAIANRGRLHGPRLHRSVRTDRTRWSGQCRTCRRS